MVPNRTIVLWLLVGNIFSGPAQTAALVQSPETTGTRAIGLNSVQSLDHAVLPGGDILIRLTFADELAHPPTVLTTYHPAASVSFDFASMASAIGRKLLEINQRDLRSLQLVPTRDRTRLVVNLNRPHVYETALKGKELLITLSGPPSITRQDAPDEARHSLRDVSFEPARGGGGKIIVELSDPAIPVVVRQQGRVLTVDFLGTALPTHLARRLDVTDFGTAVRAIETRRAGNVARMTIETTGAVEYSAHQVSRQFVLEQRAGER